MNKIRITLLASLLFVTALACTIPSLTTSQPEIDSENEIAVATQPSGPVDQPTGSPANLLVAYTDGSGALHLWSPQSGIRQLTSLGDIQTVVISPDGARIAFVRARDYREYSIWVINADGSGERQLVSPDDFRGMLVASDALGAAPVQLEWVPGTLTLAFNTYPYFDGPGFFPHDDLYLVDTDSGALTPLLEIGRGGMFAYSPNGSRLAVATFQSISLMNADGSNRRDDVLIYEPVMTYSEYLYYATPQWSPDGSFLRVIVPPGDPLADPPPPTAVWHIPGDGSAASQIASLEVAFLAVARLSPDLNRIMYVNSSGSVPALYIANAGGSQDTLYAPAARTVESWSPDGSRFLFTVNDGNQMMVGRLGESPAPLDGFDVVVNPLWVDPHTILFVHPADAGFELHLAQVGGQSVLIDTLQSDRDVWFPVMDVYP
jgi:dipeptidyl aminopeptidase/acylaminoacyl peptidase